MRAALFLVISPQKTLATLGARRDNFINQLIKCWVHDPEKWAPVFRKDHAQTIGWSAYEIRHFLRASAAAAVA
jgi:hypothetical protein